MHQNTLLFVPRKMNQSFCLPKPVGVGVLLPATKTVLANKIASEGKFNSINIYWALICKP